MTYRLSRIPAGLLAIVLSVFLAFPLVAAEPPVKKSTSGICHAQDSPYFTRTTRYTAYSTLDACLQSGGRLPRSHKAALQTRVAPETTRYDRAEFGDGWADSDRDCRNTHHELLAELSTGSVRWSSDGCRVVHGRWIDPYTGGIFLEARDLDIDHIVPLYYAWTHGAARWSHEKRARFANDPVNLMPVLARVNREKGARGPTDWLPPDPGFRCQYVLRFQRIAKSYGLEIPAAEARAISDLTTRLCR